MKITNIFLIIIVVFIYSCKAQTVKTTNNSNCKYYLDSSLNHVVYTSVDDPAKYLNGIKDFNSYIIKNIEIKKQSTNQYSFNVMVVIDSTGKIVDAVVNSKTKNLTIMEQEILNVLKSMPFWTPAKCKNESVWSKIYIPIKLNYE